MKNVESFLVRHRVWLELLRTVTAVTVLMIQLVILIHIAK